MSNAEWGDDEAMLVSARMVLSHALRTENLSVCRERGVLTIGNEAGIQLATVANEVSLAKENYLTLSNRLTAQKEENGKLAKKNLEYENYIAALESRVHGLTTWLEA